MVNHIDHYYDHVWKHFKVLDASGPFSLVGVPAASLSSHFPENPEVFPGQPVGELLSLQVCPSSASGSPTGLKCLNTPPREAYQADTQTTWTGPAQEK